MCSAGLNFYFLLCFIAFVSLHAVCVRRLMTQLEVTRGVRSGAGGERKGSGPKGPDGVVLYELHSRPEHERFTESAKVKIQ